MSSGAGPERGPFHLRLPATSANLGPGFDAVALALALFLEVDAQAAETFSIEASGRSPEICSALDSNLLLETYRDVWLRHAEGEPQALALTVRNGIPLGMGCGSSAASRIAGIALASGFAALGWTRARILDEAAALEHHPDNAAACCLGGFTVAGLAQESPHDPYPDAGQGRAQEAPAMPGRVCALSFAPPPAWHALLVLPEKPFSTEVSRAVLPGAYNRPSIVRSLQNVALLVAAFAQDKGEVLTTAVQDVLHQPFRGEVCPLLPRLLPLAGSDGILSVTLSGAGSGVLLLLASEAVLPSALARVREAAADTAKGPLFIAECIPCALAVDAADMGTIL